MRLYLVLVAFFVHRSTACMTVKPGEEDLVCPSTPIDGMDEFTESMEGAMCTPPQVLVGLTEIDGETVAIVNDEVTMCDTKTGQWTTETSMKYTKLGCFDCDVDEPPAKPEAGIKRPSANVEGCIAYCSRGVLTAEDLDENIETVPGGRLFRLISADIGNFWYAGGTVYDNAMYCETGIVCDERAPTEPAGAEETEGGVCPEGSVVVGGGTVGGDPALIVIDAPDNTVTCDATSEKWTGGDSKDDSYEQVGCWECDQPTVITPENSLSAIVANCIATCNPGTVLFAKQMGAADGVYTEVDSSKLYRIVLDDGNYWTDKAGNIYVDEMKCDYVCDTTPVNNLDPAVFNSDGTITCPAPQILVGLETLAVYGATAVVLDKSVPVTCNPATRMWEGLSSVNTFARVSCYTCPHADGSVLNISGERYANRLKSTSQACVASCSSGSVSVQQADGTVTMRTIPVGKTYATTAMTWSADGLLLNNDIFCDIVPCNDQVTTVSGNYAIIKDNENTACKTTQAMFGLVTILGQTGLIAIDGTATCNTATDLWDGTSAVNHFMQIQCRTCDARIVPQDIEGAYPIAVPTTRCVIECAGGQTLRGVKTAGGMYEDVPGNIAYVFTDPDTDTRSYISGDGLARFTFNTFSCAV